MVGTPAPSFADLPPRGTPAVLFFFETDCPTCRLMTGYLNRLSDAAAVIGISQDPETPTEAFRQDCGIRFPIVLDRDWSISRAYGPSTVPALFLVDAEGRIAFSQVGFAKSDLNSLATILGLSQPIAAPFDGNPDAKPGCMSRHLEPVVEDEAAPVSAVRAGRASRIVLPDSADAWEYSAREFRDPLPVVPPTDTRVERMLDATRILPRK